MKGSLIIVAFFVLGTVVGLTDLFPFDLADTDISYYALCALMFCVGLGVGNDPQTLKNFRSLNPRLVFLPVMTIVGTLAGSAVVSMLLSHRSVADCLAVGSGFGYYSLSSIFITESKGPELGTIALLANICREILTLLAAPLLVRWFGNLAPISAGGATTMDTTLPIITRTAGQEYVVLSIFHGFLVDFSVPFLVTLFCSI
ncbi:lysine exporter LysO family protein [Bacteroides pyogenes]|uniref:Lysine exporter LysO family protein n=3 Tax=Bacteroides pyogenes TaxID=310300 RepID=A0A5D3EIU9_9BACE|nr:lysine exporter LysO family protein [Bacteroides pyogenes]GAE14813.1 putative surface protein [Bacteroides pyogenes JCM 6292]MBR8706503.1 Lysine exporter LysO [Bacteroides pyogenes]MCE9105984.1 lysine exporter LysO family protein [Bacteroides pyogenes]MDY4249737.1 lysine exporter LysO family protein [Bacteroides pyogenes]MDY5353962.1 lysine exporter LysO family protein [Bacteroides pyogenes]